MKDDRVYLQHILECIRRIEENTGAYEAFLDTHALQDAVLRNLQVLSESTQKLSHQLKDKHPQTDWRSIAAFRNVLVHGYLGIDIERIWQIAREDVPALKQTVRDMLDELGGN